MRVLITSGATKEPIDKVRYITNFSTGKTGATLADIFHDQHYEVIYVHSLGAILPSKVKNLIEYITFKDLDQILKKNLSENSIDLLIHASAVSDYSVSQVLIEDGKNQSCKDKKISSDHDLTIKLKRNPKIISRLLEYSQNKKIKIVGFKLTHTTDEQKRIDKIKKVGEYPGVELVIHNDMSDLLEGKRVFRIYKNLKLFETCDSIEKLGSGLIKIFSRGDL
jgi:phosphopantothenoylcysteine synthetase/decarboxylase